MVPDTLFTPSIVERRSFFVLSVFYFKELSKFSVHKRLKFNEIMKVRGK